MSNLTYRPGGARYVAYGVAVLMLGLTVIIGVALPDDIIFTFAELVTLALMLLAALALLHGIGRSTVVADETGVTVRNGYRDHLVPWRDIEGFAMNSGAPWPTLVTTDDDRLILFAIQGSDGPRARGAVDELRRRLEATR